MIVANSTRTTSPSPSSASTRRLSFSNRLSALGAKLNRSLSRDTEETCQDQETRDAYEEKDRVSPILPVISLKERSTSRGRDAFSTGRGGLGNIRQTSASRTRSNPPNGPDDFSDSRGREPVPNSSAKIYSTGRGGAGNIRSPSRDPTKPPGPSPTDAVEQDIIRNHIAASHEAIISSGRGGLGNISSRSRSRGPSLAASPNPNALHSTGRGGTGNILTGNPTIADALDEAERKKVVAHGTPTTIHSTGRGGLANISSGHKPGIEQVVHTNPMGRGGSGNIRHNN